MAVRMMVVVGGGSGIGAATARRLSAQGDRVVVLDRDGESARRVAGACGGQAIEVDVADGAAVDRAFAEARALAPILQGLVVSSGIADTETLASLSIERWSEVLAINLTGVFLCCRAAHRHLADGGRIVTLSSLAARTGGVITGPA